MKNFYRNFLKLCSMLVLQNVVTLSVNLADNIMLGAFSETALSGVTTVNQVQFVFQQLIMALGDGLVIFGSQYWGKKETKPVRKISAWAMCTGIFIALILFILASFFPRRMLGLFTTDQTIIEAGLSYLAIIRFTYFFFAVTQILLATLRCVEIAGIAFGLSVMTLIINCSINWILIYGHFGAPRMGAAGAAVGTLTARIAEICVLITYISKKQSWIGIRIQDYLQADWKFGRKYYKVVCPLLVIQGLWGVNTALQTAILGHMTAAAIAANSAASNLFLMVKSAAVGAASAASVTMGKTIGSGDLKLAKLYSKKLQKLFVVMGIICGVLLFFIRIPVLSLYQLSPETREMANTFLMILSVVMVGMSYQMPTNGGIIRGSGSIAYSMKVDLISTWAIVIPLSMFMAFVVKASPAIVVCCLNADQIFKCVPAFLKCNYGHWIKTMTNIS
ncbi:MATE family efflux transporter [Blautia sp. MSJ-36]|uniref:MATE family efflux transporter n=1 Tax=Blautia sp. MSJ-36 TaxID=2841530 RepID=UPI001C125C33|nr:MATE family efflux transporter [Blautia sp. MSJ-36]MBU5445897.1 MATE family efflux transporter [Blautia sp. MSJ-36]